ncbi:MAG: ABC transporter substrate-binding protein [Oscillospiraceae bacterium]|nr:ABC transporter substrate-binding protein [Oscillospiraceae bacterium]
MKKILALLLALVMVFALAACGGGSSSQSSAPAAAAPAAEEEKSPEEVSALDQLIADAQAEGELVVYGSCEEDYLSAATSNFEKLYGIKTTYQRLSTGEVPAKIEEENGKPSADVWFGGTNNPYDGLAAKGFLDNSYVPMNASHLTKDIYKDPNGYWYGIYTGLLGFMVNTDELARLGLEAPQSWDDLLKPEYKGLIWLSNYNTAGTPKLVANLMIQLKGHDEGIKYLCDLDKNVQVYTKSGSGPSKNVGTGECVIGIGFLHDGITQIVDNGYGNVALVVPSDGTACEIGPVAIFKGAAHPNAARLFMEYALSPDCVELAAQNGSYQFLVIDNAKQPEAAAEFGLDPSLVWDGYDFAKAASDTAQNVEDVMAAIAASGADTGEGRFKTS